MAPTPCFRIQFRSLLEPIILCPPSSPTHLQTCSSPSPGLCPYCASIPHTVGSLKGAFFLPSPHLDLGAPKVQSFSASVLASTCWHSRGKALIIHQPELNLALSLSSIHGGRNSNVCWANGIDLACCSHPARTEALFQLPSSQDRKQN